MIETIRDLGLVEYPDEHLVLFQDTIERLQPDHIFEWGTNWGESARIWWELTRGTGCQVHTTDLALQGEPCAERPGFPHGYWCRNIPRIRIYRGEGLETSLALYKQMKPERPLFFVDDDHRVIPNARSLWSISSLAPEAVIIVHDSKFGEPRVAVDAFLRHHTGYQVTEVTETTGATRLWP